MGKKIVKLTEGDLERIVKRIIKEDDGSFFNNLKKTILGDKIRVPNNKFYAVKKGPVYSIIYPKMYNGRLDEYVIGSFTPLEDGTFLMKYRLHDKPVPYGVPNPPTKVKTPSIEVGLNYLKDIDDKKWREDNKWDIDLTDTP